MSIVIIFMGIGHGFGKVILFNEHFVVYGIPAIVSAIDYRTIARVEKSDLIAVDIEDRRKGSAGYSESKKAQQREAVNRILNAMNLKTGAKIVLEGDLPAFSGIGASAANSVAIARALSDEFKLDLSNERINEIAYEAEKAFAGTPSGIDNTAATYGGLIWFKKGDNGNEVEPIKVKPFELVLGNSGIVANTKKVIEGVRERKEKYKEKYDRIFGEAEKLAGKAKEALEKNDLKRVGDLMNENHRLLQQIEVSSETLDKMVEIARDNGAFGAKVTGGGVGGCMVALTPGEAQERVANALTNKGFDVLRIGVGHE